MFYSNVPIFIRVQHEWRNMFIGICEGSGLRTHFNICHLKTAPHQYRHLAGLLEIFKSKLVYNQFNFLVFCLIIFIIIRVLKFQMIQLLWLLFDLLMS